VQFFGTKREYGNIGKALALSRESIYNYVYPCLFERGMNMRNPEASAKSLQTKKILADHLISMLENQSFKKITVNDICQHAMISRSAFYLHFEDKYSLLRYCMDLELLRWEEAMQNSDFHNYLVFVLSGILKNRAVYHNTLVRAQDHELYAMFYDQFSHFFTARLEKLLDQEQTLPYPVSIISAFYVGGITCSIIQWIKKDFDLSVEEMARCQENLLYGGMITESLLNQDSQRSNQISVSE
jgi:AcrR family transcriptional regulator